MQLVSAIITTHNRAELLTRAIESVLGQTYPEMEVIVVDDASTDNTSDVCAKYPIQYIYIPEVESRGGNYARNLGIRAANGEYCAFLDDDDYWLPTKIEKQMALALDKDSACVFCLRKYEYYENGVIARFREEPRRKPSGDLSQLIFKRYVTNTSCILAKTSLIREVGCFDENFRKWQEYDLMIRLAEKTPIYYVDEILCVYRVDKKDTNRISNDFDRVIETICKIRKKYSKRMASLPLSIRLYFYDTCIENIYKLAKKTNHRLWLWGLFLPRQVLRIYKMLDDREFAKEEYNRTLMKKSGLLKSVNRGGAK